MSSLVLLGSFVAGLAVEFLLVVYVLASEGLNSICEFNNMGD